ncbi:MAG: OmpH family outer membrane protein [Bacteroidota bacterium]|nr:OmpH family outer membrane protein [Bacteroidota bacterium]MEC8968223.1 OmpH family outer membrane protein [Bacteroidota bacterium]
MKKQFLLIALFGLLSMPVISQKYAFIDTKYILSQMPEYTTAQKEIDDMAEKWQKEIEQQYNEIEQKYKAYQAEEILLPDETKKTRQQEIIELEMKAKEMQKKRFGVEGDLFKKRKELIDPIQEKIYKAVKQLAKDNSYSFILDKSKNSNIIYAEPKYDKSDAVLRKINN